MRKDACTMMVGGY